MSLHDNDYATGELTYEHRSRRDPDHLLVDYLDEAKQILTGSTPPDEPPVRPELTEDFEHLRWFTLPDEVTIAG